MNNDIKNLKKRLIYRSQYRGTKEMDKLLGSFVKSIIDNFSLDQLLELEKFLSLEDDFLYKLYNNQIETVEGISEELNKLFKLYIYKK